jgi:hypothetical protein
MADLDTARVAANRAFNRSFQQMFDVIAEVTGQYRQVESLDGGLAGVSAREMDDEVRAYKLRFDQTDPLLHVDSVLELYARVRSSLHRGYQCDSWLNEPNAIIYHGAAADAADAVVISLNRVARMLECVKRGDSTARSAAAVLRIKFARQLYEMFAACIEYAHVVEGEENIRMVTPSTSSEADLQTLRTLQTECLNDLPKPPPPPPGPSAGASPFGALGSMFQGNMADIAKSLLSTLPSMTQRVAGALSRATGQELSSTDQQMMSSTISNVTEMLGSQESINGMIADVTSGPEGIDRFLGRLLAPAAGAAPPAPTVAEFDS